MTGELDDHVAVVTGAAGSIGSATAVLLASRGAALVVADLSIECLGETADQYAAYGEVLRVAVDQRISPDVDAMVAAAVQRFGRIDALVNNAGIWDYALVGETSEELWLRTLDVNLTGTFRCCKSAIPALRRSERGSIVNVSSTTAFRPVPTVGAYAASKGGIVSFSRVLAVELAPQVRVNVVAPGPTEAAAHERMAALGPLAVQATQVSDQIPMGRLVRPGEVAETIAFAISPRAEFMTGNTLHVNGGRFTP